MNYFTDLQEIEAAVRNEIEGPGQLLGYRAMHKNIREQHQLAVPRDSMYDVMTMVNPERLERCGNVGRNKQR